MEKDELPKYADVAQQAPQRPSRQKRRVMRMFALTFISYIAYTAWTIASNTQKAPSTLSVTRLQEEYASCKALRHVPQDPVGQRDRNPRWVEAKPMLIRNATVWTDEPVQSVMIESANSGNGFGWYPADVLVQYGLIKTVTQGISEEDLPEGTEIFNAGGRPLTAGIVDMHSHAGEGSYGDLQNDGNELSSDITPYVKSIDAVDPLVPEFSWIKSGGVTTTLILPGSGNNMGGEAFPFKTAVGNSSGRAELSQQDMLADYEHSWRYMKMACGENAKRVYGKVGEHGPTSRMGEAWEFRHAFEQASALVKSQDDWCDAAEKYGAESMTGYLPKELHWESLGAVLRGQIRVNTHCYTIPDLEAYVRLTNEFKFQVRAFHHAHQTYLVPDVLKRAWGPEPPASALFADNMYYKVEGYTASEQAGKILHENGLVPVYVSDNPVLNSQHVVVEAAKAYRNGLPYHVALAGVTSEPARLLGLKNRVGKISSGFDADIVVWDSDPLSIGATPVQVWIDGASQFKDPVVLDKPVALLEKNIELGEIKEQQVMESSKVSTFTGVTHINIGDAMLTFDSNSPAQVVIRDGAVECVGTCTASGNIIHLNNGYLTRPFTAFGSSLGLIEIDGERATHDGFDAEGWTRALDGLSFGGKQLAATYAHGVTKAITAPVRRDGAHRGVSAGFLTGSPHALAKNAVFADEVAVHFSLVLGNKEGKTPSISSNVAALRDALLTAISSNSTHEKPYSESAYLKKVVTGALPIVITVHSADTIASVIRMKHDVESAMPSDSKLRLIVHGAAESWIVAPELAAADIPVVLAPLLPYSTSWEQRRSLTGAPLTNGTAIDHLLDAGVKVAIGVGAEGWEARDLPLLAGVAYANGGGRLTEREAMDLIDGNLYEMLGLEVGGKEVKDEWVLWEGSPLSIEGRIRAVSDGSGAVNVWM